MTRYSAVNIGQRTRIEGNTVRPLLVRAQATARAEDRYRSLGADTILDIPREATREQGRTTTEQPWALGEVLVQTEAPWLFELIVYDLDVRPIVDAETVTEGLENLMDTLCRCRISELALEPIGMAHGGISAQTFAQALLCACERAPVGLRVIICEPDRQALDRVLEACAELSGRYTR